MKWEFSKEKYIGLGHVPLGIGAIIKGWNIPEEHFRNSNLLSVVDFRAMTPACPLNCFHCFTDKMRKKLTLKEIKHVIDQIAEMKGKAIDFLGEGEPTLDKDFFEIIEYTASKKIQPIVFTIGTERMKNPEFIRRLKKTGVSIVLKCDSLWNPEYQNWIVRDKTKKYYNQRQEVLKLLIKEGFNKIGKDGTTRLGFDMVISRKNMREVERTLLFCRDNNLWIIFAFFLPAGRSGSKKFNKALILSRKEKIKIWKRIKEIDEKEYGFKHVLINNFAPTPCVELIQIYGDGRVSPCPGNEAIIGNVKTHSLKELKTIIIEKFPAHNPKTFDGYCPYRERFRFLD